MKNEPWDKHVMDGILAVNRNLHKGGMLPEKAQRMLYGLEDCLCSGDGLSPQTAFRAQDERVAAKAMELLGMDSRSEKARFPRFPSMKTHTAYMRYFFLS